MLDLVVEPEPIACSDSSRTAGEAVWGTANEGVTTWVMVEDRGPWGARVPEQAQTMDEAARVHLLALDARDDLRVELIRRPASGVDAHDAGPRVAYVGRVDEQGGALWRIELGSAAELAALDPAGIASGAVAAARVFEPVFFVCTHGTRDACCARRGMPVYRCLAELYPASTWQCSHLGGHRFAPTLLVLPHGAVYGHVEAEQAQALAQAARAGHLYDPARLRGRSCYLHPVQAAEAMLRQILDRREVDALRLRGCAPVASPSKDARWAVRFEDARGLVHLLELAHERLRLPVLGSCGDHAPAPAASFRLLRHVAAPP
jgi:hypothetical protein